MKHWKKEKDRISLKHGEESDWNGIFDIIRDNKCFIFEEGCDNNFSKTFTKSEAIKALEEAIQYIKDN